MKEQDSIVIYKLRKITVISLVFMTIEFLGGYYANSIAIFADAFHLLSDVSAYVISLYAVHKSYQLSPKTLTFGYEKVQPLGALINVAIIWVVTLELFIEATQRIFNYAVVEEPLLMLGTSLFGLLCNLYIMRVLHNDEHAGGHQGCSHSHHQHAEASQSRHEHDHSCHHEHNKLKDEHEHEHEHGHGCQHEHKHEEQHEHDHHHHEHEHEHSGHHQAQHHASPKSLHSHSACSHSHSEQLKSFDSHRKMSDELLPTIKSGRSSSSSFHNNINIEAAYIHILTDIILSIGVILSAGIIYFFAPAGHVWSYWQLADPLCTYLFSFMAIYSTVPIVRESLLFLLDGCNDEKLLSEIEQQLAEEEGVEVEALRVWSTNRGKHYGALRVRVRRGAGEGGVRGVFASRGVEGFVEVVGSEGRE